MWIIERTDQGGGYVNQPGSQNAYTHSKTRARRFDSKEAAQAECCPDNEVPVCLWDLLLLQGRN